jgi:hypothetical protein
MARWSIFSSLIYFGGVTLIGRAASQVVSFSFPSLSSTVTLIASGCFNGITTLRACSSLLSTLGACAVPAQATAQLDCYCQQSLFDLFTG